MRMPEHLAGAVAVALCAVLMLGANAAQVEWRYDKIKGGWFDNISSVTSWGNGSVIPVNGDGVYIGNATNDLYYQARTKQHIPYAQSTLTLRYAAVDADDDFYRLTVDTLNCDGGTDPGEEARINISTTAKTVFSGAEGCMVVRPWNFTKLVLQTSHANTVTFNRSNEEPLRELLIAGLDGRDSPHNDWVIFNADASIDLVTHIWGRLRVTEGAVLTVQDYNLTVDDFLTVSNQLYVGGYVGVHHAFMVDGVPLEPGFHGSTGSGMDFEHSWLIGSGAVVVGPTVNVTGYPVHYPSHAVSAVSFVLNFQHYVDTFDVDNVNVTSTTGGSLVLMLEDIFPDTTKAVVTVTGMTTSGLVRLQVPAGLTTEVFSGAPNQVSNTMVLEYDHFPPQIISTTPTNGTLDVTRTVGTVTAIFNEPVKVSSSLMDGLRIFEEPSGALVTTVSTAFMSVCCTGLGVEISNIPTLNDNQWYTVSLATGAVLDVPGNAHDQENFPWQFFVPDTSVPLFLSCPGDVTISPRYSEIGQSHLVVDVARYDLSAVAIDTDPLVSVSNNFTSNFTNGSSWDSANGVYPVGQTTTVQFTAVDSVGRNASCLVHVTVASTDTAWQYGGSMVVSGSFGRIFWPEVAAGDYGAEADFPPTTLQRTHPGTLTLDGDLIVTGAIQGTVVAEAGQKYARLSHRVAPQNVPAVAGSWARRLANVVEWNGDQLVRGVGVLNQGEIHLNAGDYQVSATHYCDAHNDDRTAQGFCWTELRDDQGNTLLTSPVIRGSGQTLVKGRFSVGDVGSGVTFWSIATEAGSDTFGALFSTPAASEVTYAEVEFWTV